MKLIPGGPKKQKQLNGNSHATAFVFLDHPVAMGFYLLVTEITSMMQGIQKTCKLEIAKDLLFL